MTIWTIPQLYGSPGNYGYRIRYGISENHQNAPILVYYDLKAIERNKTESRVFLQDGEGGPWVLISGYEPVMSDVALGLDAVKKLRSLRAWRNVEKEKQ